MIAVLANDFETAKEFAMEHRIETIHISITNTDNEASAFVVGEMEGLS